MMEVLITDEQECLDIDLDFIKDVAIEIMTYIEAPGNSQLSLVFCDDEAIKELNNEYRGNNQPTDVLSFPIELENFVPEIRMLGDIVISAERAIKQAKEYDHSVETEIVILLIHGLLHLNGFDHIKEDEYKIMRAKENDVFKHICEIDRFSNLNKISTEPLIERVSERV